MKLLYIEDHPQQREVIKHALELKGYDVKVAKDAEEGLEQTEQWLPDIILMDLRLPKMKGFEAIETLKQHPNSAISSIPIIVVSAWHVHRKKSVEVGADSFLAKPFEINSLIKVITKLTAQTQQ